MVVLGLARGVLEGARGASLSSRCQPRPLVPPSREKKSLNSTLSCRDCDERPFLLCCKKCSVAKNANSADSGPIKTAPRPNPNENDVSKNVVLNCWIPCSGWAILRAVCDSTRALDPAESHSTRDPIPTPPRSSDEPAPWLSSRGCASPPPPKKLSPPNSTAFLATPRRACSSRHRRAPLERPHRPSESIPFVFPLVFPVERSVPIHRRFARTPLRRS